VVLLYQRAYDLNNTTSSTGVRYFTNKGDQGGYAGSGGVDFNQDGFDDIIIGAYTSNNYSVLFGSVSPMDWSHLGKGVISLNATVNILLWYKVTEEKRVGTNIRIVVSGLLRPANPVMISLIYWIILLRFLCFCSFRDFLLVLVLVLVLFFFLFFSFFFF
jgi:hypothetical protein